MGHQASHSLALPDSLPSVLSTSQLVFQPHQTVSLIPHSCSAFAVFLPLHVMFSSVLPSPFYLETSWKSSTGSSSYSPKSFRFYSILLSFVTAPISLHCKYINVHPSIFPINLIPSQGSILFFIISQRRLSSCVEKTGNP